MNLHSLRRDGDFLQLSKICELRKTSTEKLYQHRPLVAWKDQPFPQFVKPAQNIQVSILMNLDSQRQDTNINTNIIQIYDIQIYSKQK